MLQHTKRFFARLETLIVLAICVLVGAMAWHWHKRQVASVSGDHRSPAAAPTPDDHYLPENQRLPRSYEELLQRTGMARFPISTSRGRLRLELNVTPVAVCHWGDLDIFNQELRRARASELLLTIEELSSLTKAQEPRANLGFSVPPPLAIQRLEWEPLRQRQKVALKVDFDSALPARWGVFICLDTFKTGHCADKSPAQIDAPTRKMDRILYFNALYHEESGELLGFQNGSVPLMDATYFLYRWFGLHQRGDWPEHESVLGTGSAIGSVALRSEGENKLALYLPYIDIKACSPDEMKKMRKGTSYSGPKVILK